MNAGVRLKSRMLPQRAAPVRSAGLAVVACLALLAVACGPADTPDARVRAVVAAGERAAEERDLSGLMELVSPTYRDDEGNGIAELRQYLRGYLVMHQSVHLATKLQSVEFPYRDVARVELLLGALGQGDTAGGFDLASDAYEVDLELRLEDEEWRVVRARWRPAAEGGAATGR